ncbi:hypothetical protein CEY00_Acc28766 [Actinidia chinensis var. chinensis]|uniref:Uncharacterized protein n=1 Tax=Actinidia chinensis var. chinensis TaxID=1590841 RepID=A0A2R6PHR6_ACTCC|nr:hypothetical protein CEY00_Acc28766 [Actinidia chinensis var. chinensis]
MTPQKAKEGKGSVTPQTPTTGPKVTNAPNWVSPQRSPRFLVYDYSPPSQNFVGLHFGFDTSLPPSRTDSVSPELRQQLNRCSLEEETSVEIINPSMDEKFDSRQLDSSEQQMKNAMETRERKRQTKRVITLEDLQPHFGRKLADAAKILGVSVSTFKRYCRRNGIKWKNVNEFSQALELDPKHRETPGEKTTPSCKTPSITGQAETGNQVLDSRMAKIKENLQEQNNFQTDNVSKEVEAVVSEGDSNGWPMLPCSDPAPRHSIVTIKAIYGEDILKFDLSSTSGIVELKEEVAKRLELESDNFKVKYQDEDQEWILIACDADFQLCLKFSSSLGNQLINILVVDRVFNFEKS